MTYSNASRKFRAACRLGFGAAKRAGQGNGCTRESLKHAKLDARKCLTAGSALARASPVPGAGKNRMQARVQGAFWKSDASQ